MIQVATIQRGSHPAPAGGGRGAASQTGFSGVRAVGHTTTPKFSGDLRARLVQTTTERLVPVFQNISEVFLWTFLAQDLGSMVLPRIFKGTFRGRDEWEPSQDPNAQKQPFMQQAKLWLVNNFKGLNWSQGTEETKRELSAGPGLLLVAALPFAILSKTFGKSALELSAPSLEGLSHGFIQKLQHAEQAGKPVGVRQAFRQHLDELFIDPGFRSHHEDYLREWVEKWATTVETHADNPKLRNRELGALSEEFAQKAWDFNRRHRALDYRVHLVGEAKARTVTQNLHRADQVWVRMGGEARQQGVKSLLKDLTRWSDYVGAVTASATEGKPVSQVAERVLKRLITKKFFMGIGLTLAGGLYMIRVTKWAMSNSTYQANRKLQMNGAAPGGGAPQAGGQATTQAGSANQAAPVAQPASQAPAAQFAAQLPYKGGQA